MNDALCPLSRNVVSANAARPSGAGSAGMNAGRSTSVTAITPSSIDTLFVAVATNAKRGPTYSAARGRDRTRHLALDGAASGVAAGRRVGPRGRELRALGRRDARAR